MTDNINFREKAGFHLNLGELAFMLGGTDEAANEVAAACCYAEADSEEGSKAADGLIKDVAPQLKEAGADLSKIEVSEEVKADVGQDIVDLILAKIDAATRTEAKAA